jgi:Na+/H+ antiporter NhaD/arsenite permease-like protein
MTNIRVEPNPLIMLTFAALLLSIALAPVIFRHHWERHYHKLCLGLAAITSSYYVFALGSGTRVLHATLDYVSFMVVVGSFFVVAGCIHLRIRGRGRPALNTLFLLGGTMLGNIIGTTGASMLLIRPWIALNRNRFGGIHTVFFIFTVSNLGGALLPVGPPLFLGYLKGVPFWWALQRCWLPWSVTLATVLIIFCVLDSLHLRKRRLSNKRANESASGGNWHCDGAVNFISMLALLAALIVSPAGWREVIMASIAVAAYLFTPRQIHRANEFTFAPIKEVAWIFLGIFGTMIPVLDYMERHAVQLGLRSDLQFYWGTGALSALLDNAPTYLTFLAGALGLHGLSMENAAQMSEFVSRHDHYLVALSLGATCFGALTYVGNGPNLLVKAIAEHAKIETPSFFGYTFKFAVPVLAPIFVLVSILFFWK